MRRQTALVITGAILLLTANLHAGTYTNPADINNDHRVDIDDLSEFAAAYLTEHTPDPNWNPACDIADPADGDVNEVDALALAAEWLWSGATPDPNQWAYIPSGEFLMGDHFDEGDRYALPVHAVYLDSFYMSRYEVTNQQYCDYLNDANSLGLIKVVSGYVYASGDMYLNEPFCYTFIAYPDSPIDYSAGVFSVRSKPEIGGRDMLNDPMVYVSWYGADAYCEYYGYSLPTEAEWEYAARGGNHSPYYRFPWGNTINHDYANYFAKGSNPPYDTNPYSTYTFHPEWNDGIYPYTAPGGSFSPNGYGLYDMTGNVYEWCNDWSSYYYDTSPYDNPTGPASGRNRVIRDGSWYGTAMACRVSSRSQAPGDGIDVSIGFRVVLDF